MTKKHKKFIEETLERFYFVNWDRYTNDKESNTYSLYGWIDREKDKYKDFIEICYTPNYPDDLWDFTTSSADFHDEICRILGIVCDTSNHCIRIEKDFEVANSIKLSTA